MPIISQAYPEVVGPEPQIREVTDGLFEVCFGCGSLTSLTFVSLLVLTLALLPVAIATLRGTNSEKRKYSLDKLSIGLGTLSFLLGLFGALLAIISLFNPKETQAMIVDTELEFRYMAYITTFGTLLSILYVICYLLPLLHNIKKENKEI